jgi:hypothetical protein
MAVCTVLRYAMKDICNSPTNKRLAQTATHFLAACRKRSELKGEVWKGMGEDFGIRFDGWF